MLKNHSIKRSATTGKFVSKAIGLSKASKFLSVEGLVLNQKSTQTLKHYRSTGLKGDELRSAITDSFKNIKRK